MFRFVASTLLVLTSFTAQADIWDELDECKITCSDECNRMAKNLIKEGRLVIRHCENNTDPEPPRERGAVLAYRSDNCSSNLVATLSPSTSCDSLSTSERVWAVEINGVCNDIPDTNLNEACHAFGTGGKNGVKLFKSDHCTSDLVSYVGPSTICENLPNKRVWGVETDGECKDISDTTAVEACKVFQNGVNGTKIYRSDSCSSNLVATIGQRTDCSQFAGSSARAWAVEFGTTCHDISDTSIEDACTNFAGGKRGTFIFRSDDCSSNMIASVSSHTDCSQFASSSQRAWAIQIDGQCRDISDTSLETACERFKQ